MYLHTYIKLLSDLTMFIYKGAFIQKPLSLIEQQVFLLLFLDFGQNFFSRQFLTRSILTICPQECQ